MAFWSELAAIKAGVVQIDRSTFDMCGRHFVLGRLPPVIGVNSIYARSMLNLCIPENIFLGPWPPSSS